MENERKSTSKNKYLIIGIISVIVILISGTIAFFTWQSKRSRLVLTVGTLDDVQITLSPYEVDLDIAPIENYENGAMSSVTAVNNGNKIGSFQLLFDVIDVDQALIASNDMKYMITKSTTLNGEYTPVTNMPKTFSNVVNGEELLIYEEEIPSNTTYYYKVYTYLQKEETDQSDLMGLTFKTALTAKIR